MDNGSSKIIEEIDALLEDGEPGEEQVDRLVELLTPGASEPWPDLEVVLHVAEHPAIADDLQMHELAAELEAAICEALEAVLPMLGVQPYGPTFKIAEIARRELDAEGRKYELVAEKIAGVDRAEAVAMIARYLGTEPAPMFVNRMRQLHPELVADAEQREGAGRPRLAEGGREIVELLEDPTGEPEEVAEAIADALADRQVPTEHLAEAIGSDDPDEQLMAAALVGWTGASRLVPAILRRIVDGSQVSPQLAVIAGLVAPEPARNVFSQLLAEATWQNPELPDAELTDQRVRAILSARSVLPRVGSPMESMTPEQVSEDVDDERLRQIPAFVERYWAVWSAVRSG